MANKREDSKLKITKDAITQDWKRRQGYFSSLIGNSVTYNQNKQSIPFQ